MDALEYHECCTLAEYLDALQRQGRILRYGHIPNETWTKSWSQKIRNKKQGVKKGFPDYMIIFPKELVFIEMKRAKGGVTSPEQSAWLNDLMTLGTTAEVCHGFDAAKKLIDSKL